jgi:hypothetical protein
LLDAGGDEAFQIVQRPVFTAGGQIPDHLFERDAGGHQFIRQIKKFLHPPV